MNQRRTCLESFVSYVQMSSTYTYIYIYQMRVYECPHIQRDAVHGSPDLDELAFTGRDLRAIVVAYSAYTRLL